MTLKGKNLAVLANRGIRTPRGFLLGTRYYQTFIGDAINEIEAVIGNYSATDKLFQELPFPNRTLKVIDAEISKIAGAERFAVRSSGSVVSGGIAIEEDSSVTALAGQFESWLNVRPVHLPTAIRCCYASLFGPRCSAFFKVDRSYVTNSTMSVVIQEMVDAAASAVMFTANPLDDGTTGSIDLTIGPCEALVSGAVSPDEVTFARDTGDILSFDIGRKERSVVYDDFIGSNNRRFIDNSEAESAKASVSASTVGQIIEIGRRIEAIFGAPQDVELVVTHDGEIVITQARAVTGLIGEVTPFTNTNHDIKES